MRNQLRGQEGQVPEPKGDCSAEGAVGTGIRYQVSGIRYQVSGFRLSAFEKLYCATMKRRAVFFLLLFGSVAGAQTSNLVHEYVASHQREIVKQFSELLAMPNVASDAGNIRKNAEYIAAQLK